MNLKCLECSEEFATSKSLHCHFKAHGLTVGDYYVKHFPRKDKLTHLQLPYKKYDQYFSQDFSCLDNFITWCETTDKQEVQSYLTNFFKNKFESKQVTVSPPNLYYQLSHAPDINNIKNIFGSYKDFLKNLDIERWFCKNLPEKFWEESHEDLDIFVDTREKDPIIFKNSIINKLDFGDYTTGGKFYTKTFVDRKSQDDFRHTFGKDIDRFRREMDRCVYFNCYMFVVVESSIDKIEEENARSKFKSNLCYLWHNVRHLITDYPKNLQFIFAHSRKGAEKIVPRILYHGDKLWNVDLQYHVDQKIYGMGKRPTKISS